ncbi:MAG TPA: isoprenylcysteine carboxylmethyltransferase family protein [Myxococcaceae bacterium]|nr:isoprenylcysteine carboxylmethyltransferase family protein [Myxococcaceae bacterium]
MKRVAYVLYGGVCYAVFVATFLYAIAFVEGAPVPRTVDAGGPSSAPGTALLADVLLLTLFAVQHSGMARRGFKEVWTRIVPKPIERSTYVLAASAILVVLFALWRPIPAVVWNVQAPAARFAILAVSALGWLFALFSTLLLNHFELFGLRQAYLAARRREVPSPRFRTPWFYKWVRHPLYLGFILAFWAAPTMTVGRLVFALGMLGYILVAIQLEERDLVREYGAQYRAYRDQVPALVPIPRRVPTASDFTVGAK